MSNSGLDMLQSAESRRRTMTNTSRTRAVFFVVALGSSLFLTNHSAQSALVPPQDNPPYLMCGGAADIECSYILWNSGGSRGFVVPPRTQRYPISEQYLGFKYCMHADHPRAAQPKWPECFDKNPPQEWNNTHGIIKRGKNG
jgi:hypothetical protein